MLQLTKSKRVGEFIRFLIVGGASALANTLIIILLTEIFRIDYLISYAICFICVTSIGFAVNRSWSFRVGGRARSREVGRYFLTTFAATLVAMTVSRLMVELGTPYPIAVFLSAAVLAPANFITHRKFSFSLRPAVR